MSAGRPGAAGAGLVAVLAMAACADDNTGGNTDINPAQAAVIGQAAVAQLGGLANGLGHFTTPGVGGLASGFFAPAAPGGRVLLSSIGRLNPAVRRSLALI